MPQAKHRAVPQLCAVMGWLLALKNVMTETNFWALAAMAIVWWNSDITAQTLLATRPPVCGRGVTKCVEMGLR